MSQIECTRILDEIEAYVDGEVGLDRVEEIEGHLAECDPCFEKAEFRKRLKEILARKCGGGEAVPAPLADRIRSMLDAAETT